MNPVTPGLQLGRYAIRAKLGAGGMADVFLADDLQLGRRVALKSFRRRRRPIPSPDDGC
jgi:eukaryotic-like serine/threonine-protein kinase